MTWDAITAVGIFVTQSVLAVIQLWNRNQQARQHAENKLAAADLKASLTDQLHKIELQIADVRGWALEKFVQKGPGT